MKCKRPQNNEEGKGANLTIKQRKLVKGIADGKTQKQAALEAGYSPKNADNIASHELKKTQVSAAIQDLMEELGLDDKSLLRIHKDMLEAKRIISVMVSKEANGGGTVDFIDVPDWQARGKGLEMAYKLKGAFTDKVKYSGIVTLESLVAGMD